MSREGVMEAWESIWPFGEIASSEEQLNNRVWEGEGWAKLQKNLFAKLKNLESNREGTWLDKILSSN